MTSKDAPRSLGRFVSVADAAEILNISVSSTYGLVRSGELPAIRIGAGGQWRIESSAIDAYIEARYEQERRTRLWERPAREHLDEPSWS